MVVALINKAKSSLVQNDSLQNTSSTVVMNLIRLANVDIRALDWEVLDNKNLTPLDVLNSGYNGDTLVDQVR